LWEVIGDAGEERSSGEEREAGLLALEEAGEGHRRRKLLGRGDGEGNYLGRAGEQGREEFLAKEGAKRVLLVVFGEEEELGRVKQIAPGGKGLGTDAGREVGVTGQEIGFFQGLPGARALLW